MILLIYCNHLAKKVPRYIRLLLIVSIERDRFVAKTTSPNFNQANKQLGGSGPIPSLIDHYIVSNCFYMNININVTLNRRRKEDT